MFKTELIEYQKKITGETNFYDGLFYEMVVVRFYTKKHGVSQLLSMVEEEKNILDVGCGTGFLSRSLSRKSKSVTGLDFSPKMISFAKKNLIKDGIKNVEFILGDMKDMSRFIEDKFDYALACVILHELDEETRLHVLSEIRKVSKRVIIHDFINPMPVNLWGFYFRFMEFNAGKEHFRNYLDWQSKGGIDGFIKRNNLNLIEEKVLKGGGIKNCKIEF